MISWRLWLAYTVSKTGTRDLRDSTNGRSDLPVRVTGLGPKILYVGYVMLNQSRTVGVMSSKLTRASLLVFQCSSWNGVETSNGSLIPGSCKFVRPLHEKQNKIDIFKTSSLLSEAVTLK